MLVRTERRLTLAARGQSLHREMLLEKGMRAFAHAEEQFLRQSDTQVTDIDVEEGMTGLLAAERRFSKLHNPRYQR